MQELSPKVFRNFIRLDTMNIDVSSRLLRQWIQEGKSLPLLCSDEVIAYIGEQKIYRRKRDKAYGTV